MADSLRGQFLVASRSLNDPNFFKTVVLIVEHTPDGAMGLIVNRPSSVTVSNALSMHFSLPETDELVHVGGPVEPSDLFILHNAAELEVNERPVLPGLFVGSNGSVFEEVVRSLNKPEHGCLFRIYSGCAGWAPNQLEHEIQRGDWFMTQACPEMVFSCEPYDSWDCCLKKIWQENRMLPHTVRNPEWN